MTRRSEALLWSRMADKINANQTNAPQTRSSWLIVRETTRGETTVLQGFFSPLTPKGKSTLNPPPPWYYSADFLCIEFWADPTVVAATLPAGLDPDPSAAGH